jgi:hypothetical protein
VRVVGLAGLRAVVELAEHAVVEVTQGGGVTVAAFAACQIVIAGGSLAADGSERPDESDGGEAVVFHLPMGDADAAPGGLGDRRGPGERLQRSGVGEWCSVVADFGEQACTGEVTPTSPRFTTRC